MDSSVPFKQYATDQYQKERTMSSQPSCLILFIQWQIQHRQKSRMMTTMTRLLPQHQWHEHHCRTNDSWQQIQPAVYMVDSRFIKCFMFYQMKKWGVQPQENVKYSQPMSKKSNQCYEFQLWVSLCRTPCIDGCHKKKNHHQTGIHKLNTLRTGDTDLRFYITTVQDGWCKSAFLTSACFPCTIHLIMQYTEPVSKWSCWRMFIET